MGRRENTTDPPDARTNSVQSYRYFAYPDFLYRYFTCYLSRSRSSSISFSPLKISYGLPLL